MASNRVKAQGRFLTVTPTKGLAASGAVVGAGTGIAGVCQGSPDAGSAPQPVVIDTEGVYSLTVLGSTVGAVAVGDAIYCHAANGATACTLDNVATSGIRLGTALQATSTDSAIPVKLRNA